MRTVYSEGYSLGVVSIQLSRKKLFPSLLVCFFFFQLNQNKTSKDVIISPFISLSNLVFIQKSENDEQEHQKLVK